MPVLSTPGSLVRALPQSAIESLAARGMAPRPRSESDDAVLLQAYRLIEAAPDLAQVVAYRVHGIGVIASAGPDYDSSHSEPQWPGWIFVSVPSPGPTQVCRLAEGIVHEAMHHQLSALEAIIPLISVEAPLHSPWKGEPRLASGVLHGLYVFACLIAYFRKLAALQADCANYALGRIQDITKEIEQLDQAGLQATLTQAGLRFVQMLIRTV